MSFLLDTDICSAYLKGDRRVFPRFVQHGGQLHVCALTVGELYTWALRASAPPRRLEVLVDLLRDVRVLDVNTEVGRKFGELRATLLDAGKRTPQVDLFIAATALFHGLTLVSHNVQDFADVPDLSVVDWLAA